MGWTVGQIAAWLAGLGGEGGGGPTVDGLKIGSAAETVTGIVVAFMPTVRVLERAVGRGANMVVVHEGVYYSHRDAVRYEGDGVSEEKRRRLEASGLALYRIHDAIHRERPDGITAALVAELGWAAYPAVHEAAAAVVELPPVPLGQLAKHVKLKLGLPYVRAIGDPGLVCAKAGVLVGYRGTGSAAIPLLARAKPDVLVVGEAPEWETPEHVRDAGALGMPCAMLVIGHAESEEPGMRALAVRLRAQFPGVPVYDEKAEPLYRIV